tara:strand:+ start:272 stop:928 length:657 start_codon:yes stop_codon:yes gene_type:complete
MLFPIVICDNFFDDPDHIVEYGKSLDYKDLKILPGSRTDALHTFNEDFFNWITTKSLKLIYPNEDCSYIADARFQKIPASLEHDGWVHTDTPSELTVVVYLSKHTDTGISFYKAKNKLVFKDKQKLKYDYFENPNRSQEELEKIKEAKKINNEFFQETIHIKGEYNRCVIFDSSVFHSAHTFAGNKTAEDRFIFVNIVYSVSSPKGQIKYPISESKRV